MLTRLTGVLAVPVFTLTLAASARPAVTAIRAITTTPDHYANRPVTLTGRYRGRMASGNETALTPLNRSRWDFLLTSHDDAVIWISGLRPASWDFDLDPKSDSRSGSDRWLEVTARSESHAAG